MYCAVSCSIEPVDVIPDGHALTQLFERRSLERVAQIRLADQHDLNELRLLRLHVGEHAELFQSIEREVLCLVDDRHDPPAGSALLDEHPAPTRGASAALLAAAW